jgi:hypothetical protein
MLLNRANATVQPSPTRQDDELRRHRALMVFEK